jgi:capsular exopolysaccharide synthesis family protein
MWILLCLVVVAGATYGYSKQKTKKYTATATLAFGSNQLDQQIAGLAGGSTLDPLAQEASDVEVVKFSGVAAKVASLLGHGLTAETVSASLDVKGQGEGGIVGVEVTSPSPNLAAAIANAYVSQFVDDRQSVNRHYFKSALTIVNKQLAGLTPAQRFGSDGLDLEDRAHTLALLAELGYNNVGVAQEASIPFAASSPKTKTNTILGGVLGLLLGIAIAFLLEFLDRRVRDAEDLEMIYRLPLLGVVPKSVALSRPSRPGESKLVALPPADAEAFSLIRAHLRFLNVDRDVRTLLIASPAPGDGKTTIARYLAEAAARLGSNVLLMETDLRHPTLAKQLDLQPGRGLADVLIGTTRMNEAVHSFQLRASTGEGASGRALNVLSAGTVLPPNPGELLESSAMDTVLGQARFAYDLVVIDTPPLMAVSDAFTLLTKVDGVVIVGRLGHSRRDVAEQLHEVLASSGAPLLGVIANESTSGGPIPYPGDGGSSQAVPSDNGVSSSEEFAPTAGA